MLKMDADEFELGQKIVERLDVAERLQKLSNKQLLELALIGALDELNPAAQAVLLEMCSRLEPEWQEDGTLGHGLPREDAAVCTVARHYAKGMKKIASGLRGRGF